jgi:hypothetical protein
MLETSEIAEIAETSLVSFSQKIKKVFGRFSEERIKDDVF